MSFLSLDIDASRVRAVAGLPGDFPCALSLEPPDKELAMVLSLEGAEANVGRAARLVCRERPQCAHANFLHEIPEDIPVARLQRPQVVGHQAKRLHSSGTILTPDPSASVRRILRRIAGLTPNPSGVTYAIPPYLTTRQLEVFVHLSVESGLPVAGVISSPLALTLSAYAEHPWTGPAILLDLDEHMFWVSLLKAEEGHAKVLDTFGYEHLGLRHWHQRVLDGVADHCIQHTRRDPRDCPAAEQALYMQLQPIMEQCVHGHVANVTFQTHEQFHHLVLLPEHTEGFCASLTQEVLAETISAIDHLREGGHPTPVLLVSHQTSFLPGLVDGLDRYFQSGTLERGRKLPHSACYADFGEKAEADVSHGDETNTDFHPPPSALILLPPDAGCRGAFSLAPQFLSEQLPSWFLQLQAPLPIPQAIDRGPARLHFQGQDYLIPDAPFLIGYAPECHLALDQNRYPEVAAQHCEIFHEQQKYLLQSLTRDGTWVNERSATNVVWLQSGDWIRLGPQGPILRFLGEVES
ncbi:MAG: FHA domain-containing protein [Gemmataceae bacterium]